MSSRTATTNSLSMTLAAARATNRDLMTRLNSRLQ
jgi:hypothetical protein